MILAAAEGADAAVSVQPAEGAPVLDRAQVGAEVLGTGDVGGVGRMPFERVDRGDGREERHDQGARARETRGAGQIAGEHDLGPPEGTREVPGDSRGDGLRVDRPAGRVGNELAVERDLRRQPPSDVGDADEEIGAGRRRDAESPARRAEKPAAAGVAGVLPEHLDAAGHEPAADRLGRASGRGLDGARGRARPCAAPPPG